MHPYSPYTEAGGELCLVDQLPLQASEALFGDVQFRPTVSTMAELINQGLTEADILSAGLMKGYDVPVMDETLRDLEVAIPFIQQLSDKIASDHGDETIWLAARDFEAVADDLMVRYPEFAAHLLPASQDLLRHRTMRNRDLATRFLGGFGLTSAKVDDPGQKFAIFDSGFRGTIGQELDDIVRWAAFGTSLRDSGRLTNKLASVNTTYSIPGEQIMDFPGGAANFSEEQLPRASRIAKYMRTEDYSDTQVLAVLLQAMPRFHNEFGKLSELGDHVVALPRTYDGEYGMSYERPIDDNVDRPNPDRDYQPNESIINPVAAAIVMYRVVKSALELKPNALEELRKKRQNSGITYEPGFIFGTPHNKSPALL